MKTTQRSSKSVRADILATRQNKPALRAGIIYSGDNGRLLCLECAGYNAKFSGRDLSGHKVTAMNQSDADHWMQVMGATLACE